MRLRVKIKNAKDCRTIITFQDLCVHYTNGYSPVLKLSEGEEVPLEFLDQNDVKKSLKLGTLKAYLENGWLEEIPEEIKKEEPVVKSDLVAQQNVEIRHEDLPQIIPPMQEKDKILVEKPASPLVVQNEPITDFNKVSSYEDFCKMTHLLKLRFIKETKNIDLLKDVLSKTPSSQFKNNINLRLSQVKV